MDVFFATGYQKSGTTFLQQLLDAHPEINCPPEHHLNTLMKALQSVLKKYRAVITQIDERTARQGVRYNENHVLQHTFKGMVTGLLTDSLTPGTKLCGLTDNSMWENLPVFAALFPGARFVGLVRDPRAVTVSLYKHRIRTEADYAETGLTMSQLAPIVGHSWKACVSAFETFSSNPDHAKRLKVARYEDLAGPDKANHLAELYTFLGRPAAPDIVSAALASNDFDVQKVKSGGFLQAGPTASWETQLDDADIATVAEHAGPALAKYGYGPVAA